MGQKIKNQKEVLNKLGITELNAMQEEAKLAIHAATETIILSPTGTGKTLAFLLPIIAELNPDIDTVQCLILVPSRELAIQIEQVAREIGSGYKINAVYGGRAVTKDKLELKHQPAILIGTPGRLMDHIERRTFDARLIETLVLDEYDKSLEVGFEEQMSIILEDLTGLKKKVLTSATEANYIPGFFGISSPVVIDYLSEKVAKLTLKIFESPEKDKLKTLYRALCHLGNQPGIIFCNYKDSIRRVSDYLDDHDIAHGCFYGGMEQFDRERVLIKFRNGTYQIIIATDLAARGLDINELKYIIHYHLPLKAQEFTHRNGRTARMHQEGTAYVMKWAEESLPDFIPDAEIEEINDDAHLPAKPKWTTLFLSGGRKDKISKGDIAGFFIKQGGLENSQLGLIELKQDCAFVAVPKKQAKSLITRLNNTHLKKRKLRIKEI